MGCRTCISANRTVWHIRKSEQATQHGSQDCPFSSKSKNSGVKRLAQRLWNPEFGSICPSAIILGSSIGQPCFIHKTFPQVLRQHSQSLNPSFQMTLRSGCAQTLTSLKNHHEKLTQSCRAPCPHLPQPQAVTITWKQFGRYRRLNNDPLKISSPNPWNLEILPYLEKGPLQI